MTRYREPTRKEWIVTGLLIGAVTTITVVGGVLMAESHPLWVVSIPMVLLLLLVYWHARDTAYRCPRCRNEFEISMLRDLVSPHMLTTKYLRCPGCGKRSWAKALVKGIDEEHGSH